MKWISCLLFYALLAGGGWAQPVTLSGYVLEAGSQEKMIGAMLHESISGARATTDNYGYFHLHVPKQERAALIISHAGHEDVAISIALTRDSSLNIFLNKSYELEAVNITSKKDIPVPEIGKLQIAVTDIQLLPAMLGEVDVMKAFQLLPGVQSGREGTSGLYVRGGTPDQNLILLDDIPLYYVNHIGGYLSIFDPNAISHVELYKGGFPARYGGRASGVMDVRMREGDKQKYHGNVGIGLISTRLAFEGPLIKDKTSFLVSLRRFNYDLLARAYNLTQSPVYRIPYFTFNDLNIKLSHIASEKDRLSLSFYRGKDRFADKPGEVREVVGGSTLLRENLDYGIQWGNVVGAFRWNHLFSPKLFGNFFLAYSHFQYKNELEYRFDRSQDGTWGVGPIETYEASQGLFSGVKDLLTGIDLYLYPDSRQTIRFGARGTRHTFRPNETFFRDIRIDYGQDTSRQITEASFNRSPLRATEISVYLEDEIEISTRFVLNVGIHAAAYLLKEKAYYNLQPRIIASYSLRSNLIFKAAYTEMWQPLHLLSSSTAGLPYDLWVPATEGVPPQRARQYSLGAVVRPEQLPLDITLEAYYKQLSGLIDFAEGVGLFSSTLDWQEIIEQGGKGDVYGGELLIKKSVGKTTGWLAYTLSWNFRTFSQFNQGQPYPFTYDRRHDLALVLIHSFTQNISLSGNWIFSTGNAITLPTLGYDLIQENYNLSQEDRFVPDLQRDRLYFSNNSPSMAQVFLHTRRNSYRMPAYHRLDVSVQFKKQKKRGERIWNLGLYNAYARLNPLYVYYGFDRASQTYKLYQYSLFPILPSLSYTRVF